MGSLKSREEWGNRFLLRRGLCSRRAREKVQISLDPEKGLTNRFLNMISNRMMILCLEGEGQWNNLTSLHIITNLVQVEGYILKIWLSGLIQHSLMIKWLNIDQLLLVLILKAIHFREKLIWMKIQMGREVIPIQPIVLEIREEQEIITLGKNDYEI